MRIRRQRDVRSRITKVVDPWGNCILSGKAFDGIA